MIKQGFYIKFSLIFFKIFFQFYREAFFHSKLFFRLAFERVLELDSDNASALVALAILDMNTLESDGIQKGVNSLGKAYQLENASLSQCCGNIFSNLP